MKRQDGQAREQAAVASLAPTPAPAQRRPELRREFSLEAVRIILGHRSAAITEVYAEKDEEQAIRTINRVG